MRAGRRPPPAPSRPQYGRNETTCSYLAVPAAATPRIDGIGSHAPRRMIKLFSVKDKQKKEAEEKKEGKKQTPGEIRLQKGAGGEVQLV